MKSMVGLVGAVVLLVACPSPPAVTWPRDSEFDRDRAAGVEYGHE
jgi:hypothetical protein